MHNEQYQAYVDALQSNAWQKVLEPALLQRQEQLQNILVKLSAEGERPNRILAIGARLAELNWALQFMREAVVSHDHEAAKSEELAAEQREFDILDESLVYSRQRY